MMEDVNYDVEYHQELIERLNCFIFNWGTDNEVMLGKHNLTTPLKTFLFYRLSMERDYYKQCRLKGMSVNYAMERVDTFLKMFYKESSRENQEEKLTDIKEHPWYGLLNEYNGALIVYLFNSRQLQYLTPLILKLNHPVLLLSEYDIPEETEFPENVIALPIEFSSKKLLSDKNFELQFPLLYHYANTFDILFQTIRPCGVICLEGCHFQEQLLAVMAESYDILSYDLHQRCPSANSRYYPDVEKEDLERISKSNEEFQIHPKEWLAEENNLMKFDKKNEWFTSTKSIIWENRSNLILSVIIPVYNVKPYLEECLHSLAIQTLVDIEVIMINDGSTDGSEELLKKWAMVDSRFHYVEQINGGLSVARNTGMMIAQGTYIAFLDSDDWLLTNDCLDRICRIADRTKADIVAGNTWSVFSDGRKNLWGKNCKKTCKPGKVVNGGEYFARMEEQGCYVPMVCNYIYRRNFLQKHQFNFEPGVIHEDELWTPQVLTSAQRVVYTDIHHYGYRQREGSIMTATSSARRIASLQIIVDKLLQYVDGYTNTETDAKLVKKAIEMNILRLYWTACSIREKGRCTTIYDKAGEILSVCEKVSSRQYAKESYSEYILLSMRDFYNELQNAHERVQGF